MRLYGYWRSSASWRVRIGLGLKGLDYAYIPVHLARDGGEQHGDAHRARNPMAQVPVLELERGGEVFQVTQSLAILELLEELFPSPPLLPADPMDRAAVRTLAEIVNAGIQPMQNLSVTQRVAAMGGDVAAWTGDAIRRGLGAIDTLAARTAGQFLVGDQPTIADCCLMPQLYSARRFGVDPSAWPRLVAIEARAMELEAFQRAHADRQPDATP